MISQRKELYSALPDIPCQHIGIHKHPFSSHAIPPKHKLTQAFKIARNRFYLIGLTEDNSSQFNRRQLFIRAAKCIFIISRNIL